MAHLIDKDAVLAEIERLREELQDKVETNDFIAGEVFIMNYFLSFIVSLEVKEVDLEKVPIILTEEILKINGFKLYTPPRYKEAFWSKIYKDKEGNGYVFDIYMEQRVEHLLTITPLATPDGKGHPDCHLPHPQTVQQLQNSLRLFGIEDIIRV